MRAWEELVGRPKYHVMRSHVIAPISPAKITAKVTTSILTRPDPMVLATAVPNVKAATKLKKAAQTTALPGVSTRVDTTVAMEFAASWKPLMKSKDRATRSRRRTARRFVSMVSEGRYDSRGVKTQVGVAVEVPSRPSRREG